MLIRYILIPLLLVSIVIYFSSRGEHKGISGLAKVIDARTLVIKARRVQLYGIDAPDLAQTCGRQSQIWPCGREAAAALSRMADNGRVTCVRKGKLKNNLIVGQCSTFDETERGEKARERKVININRLMVVYGWALANGPGGQDYIEEERAAQKARKGLWRGPFTPPWEWRTVQRGK